MTDRSAGAAALTRDFTATVFVVRGGRTLLLWHNKIKTWLPPGGHIHPPELPEEAAVREVREETGLDVELLPLCRKTGPLGVARVLHTPVCILLEDIGPGHQHIDLIYYALAVDDRQPRVNPREATGYRWCSQAELAAPEIHEDIRVLGGEAILAANAP